MLGFLFNQKKKFKEITIGNKRFIEVNLPLKGKNISIKAEIFSQNSDYVLIQKFRSDINTNEFTINQIGAITNSEYIADLEKMIAILENTSLDNQALYDTLAAICEHHISKLGRIINTDIEAYLDEIMSLADSISTSFYNEPLNYTRGNELRERFKKSIIMLFYDHVFVNVFNDNKTRLVKLTDLG